MQSYGGRRKQGRNTVSDSSANEQCLKLLRHHCIWAGAHNSCKHGLVNHSFILPPTLGILEDSWWLLDLLRFWFFLLLLAARTERKSTSLALKNATMNGCFDWGPCLPTRPADLTLILRPIKQWKPQVIYIMWSSAPPEATLRFPPAAEGRQGFCL